MMRIRYAQTTANEMKVRLRKTKPFTFIYLIFIRIKAAMAHRVNFTAKEIRK